MTTATVLVDGPGFGEGPRWRDGQLWFSDFYRHAVFTVDEDGTLVEHADLSDVADFRANDLITDDTGRAWVDPEGGIWVATALHPTVIRYAEGGEFTGEVETSQITYAVALGGADGRTLFAITAPSSDPGVVVGNTLGKVEIATV